MRKKIIIENIEIEDFAAEGKTIAHVDGKVVFIKGGAPGDIVDVKVTNKRKNFYEGFPLKFHQHSSLRIDPTCNHFGTCGGCKWQHIPYETQLAFKQQQVIDNFERLGGFEIPQSKPIMGSAEEYHYRNKLEFTFSDNRWLTQEEIDSGETFERNALGFHIPGRYDKILDINTCYLQPAPSNEIRNWVRDYALKNEISFYNIRDQAGFLRNLIIRTTTLNQTMVILQVAEDHPEILMPILENLKSQFEIESLNYVINLKKNETFFDLDVKTFSGKPYIEEVMSVYGSDSKLNFRIGPKSFYQTNSKQAEELYRKVFELAEIKPDEIVYDLYTGTGTIANFIAHMAKKVIGLESIPEAIEDARVNSEINNITNTDFFAGDIKDLLNNEFINKNGRPDIIITDPPRAGMHPSVVKMLNEVKAERIVYVSCNPATQARDIADLSELYNVVEFQPVDMFPHTHHVENIVLLRLK